MASKALIERWAKESLAMIMIGDALVTLVDPQKTVAFIRCFPPDQHHYYE